MRKQFERADMRIETRRLWKVAECDWAMIAYEWDGDDATAVPNGVSNAGGTDHDIPTQDDCHDCHDGLADVLAGVSAIQLAHDLGGTTLAGFDKRGLLGKKPPQKIDLPGDKSTQEALGYLHANCGGCHNERNDFLQLDMFLSVDTLATVEETDTHRTAVDQKVEADPIRGLSQKTIVTPGDPEASMLHARMTRRGKEGSMPPVGGETIDDKAVQRIADWISAL